jgi:hypothetical protein
MDAWRDVARTSIAGYFVVLLLVSVRSARAFTGKFGRRHRLCGLAHLGVLCLRARDVVVVADARGGGDVESVMFDLALFVSGLALTLTAHADFAKAHAAAELRQSASGPLHAKTTVTGSEMLEHAFYQIVNGFQIAYVHIVRREWFRTLPVAMRCAGALAATSIWWTRSAYPVNSFSSNYSAGMPDIESVLYRMKKWQYVLYKTVLLHGLNVSLAVRPVDLPSTLAWKMYWLLLNAAYVLEFFLQTLVKRKYIAQSSMLLMNQTLMVISTVAVLPILRSAVVPTAAFVAFALNFLNRKREMVNVAIACVATIQTS